jgi:hypothetical protein
LRPPLDHVQLLRLEWLRQVPQLPRSRLNALGRISGCIRAVL